MSVALLLTVLVFDAEPRAAASGHDAAAKVGDDEVKQLIKQLGDDDFQVRDAATKDLVALGERALPALRRAKNSFLAAPASDGAAQAKKRLPEALTVWYRKRTSGETLTPNSGRYRSAE